MKHSLLDRLSAARQSLTAFGEVFLAVLALPSQVPGATLVDIYQDMQSGSDGELLTPAIMNASSHGGGSKWSIEGQMWVSSAQARDLPGPVVVGGATYSGTGAARGWMFNDNNAKNSAVCTLPGSHANITVACYYTPGVTIAFGNQFDTIVMSGNKGFAVLQTRNDDKKRSVSRAHSCTQPGWTTTFSPGQIRVVAGKTYWVNLHFDGTAGQTSVAAFDPGNEFAQVGNMVVAASTPNSTMAYAIHFGRGDNHGNNPTAKTQSRFEHILVDYSKGAFPLLPRGGKAQPRARPQCGVEREAGKNHPVLTMEPPRTHYRCKYVRSKSHATLVYRGLL